MPASERHPPDHPAAPPGRRAADIATGRPARIAGLLGTSWVALQVTVLLALGVSAAWLMQRADLQEQRRMMQTRARTAAELVAHAAGPDLAVAAAPRLLRVLECAVREPGIAAAALVDSGGVVVAHTETRRCGMTVSVQNGGGVVPDLPPSSLETLFGHDEAQTVTQPILAETGRVGTAVVLLSDHVPMGALGRVSRFFIPAGLLLLAFAVVSQAGMRRALQPTTLFLERLARSLEPARDATAERAPTAGGQDPPAGVMERTVHEIEALARSNDELVLAGNVAEFERKRMAAVLEAFPDGLVVVSALDDVVFINRRALRVLGMGDAPAPRTLAEAPNLRRLVQDVERTGQVQLPIPGRQGEQTILFSRVPLGHADSQLGETLYTLRDVTAQKASQRTQAEFLSQISHELKAPLNTIVTFVEELAENQELTAAERREYCNVLDREAGRMAQLIGNLLQLSRIQLGNLSVKMGFVKPGQVVAEQAEAQRRHAESRGLALQVEVAENLPAVAGDKDLLGVSVTNLVSNAVKYTPAGGRVSVTATAVDGGVAVKVEDTGVGIAADAREKIFERFWRADDERVRAEGGSGLGLALVKEIVEVHGGDVSVDSEPGAGSRFRVWLPAREVGSRPVTVDER